MANTTLLGDDKQVLVCEDADLEMSDVRASPELMNRIARNLRRSTTDGRRGWNGNFCCPKLKSEAPALVEYRRTPIWSRWPYLALVLGLLTVEWVSRRTRGLA